MTQLTKNGIGHVAGSIKHRGFAAIENIRYTRPSGPGQVAFRRRTEKHKLGVYGGGGSKDCEKEEKKACAIKFTSAYTQDNGPGQAPHTQQSNRTTGETREKSHDMFVRKTLCKKAYNKSKYFSLLSKLDRYAQYCAPERGLRHA